MLAKERPSPTEARPKTASVQTRTCQAPLVGDVKGTGLILG